MRRITSLLAFLTFAIRIFASILSILRWSSCGWEALSRQQASNNLRPFADKADERNFAEEDVYFNNDFNSVQRRARIAMWTLNGLLLVFFAFAVRRTFGPEVALGTLLFLAIDPTVAAHLPVVMTDLPVSLLSASAVVLAVPAFQGWAWRDLLMCSLALGLALATKHSAPIFLIFLVLTGVALALATPVLRSGDSRFVRS